MTKKSMRKYGMVTLGSLLAVGFLAGNCFALDSSRESQFPAGYYAQHVKPYAEKAQTDVINVVTKSEPTDGFRVTYQGQYVARLDFGAENNEDL